MEPFVIEMPGADRLWTVRFEESPAGSFRAVATSGPETRKSRWRIDDDLAQALEDDEPAGSPELAHRSPGYRASFLRRGVVRLYRERLDDVVARDDAEHIITTVDALTGPRSGGYLDLIEREIADCLFEIAVVAPTIRFASVNITQELSRPQQWLVAEPRLKDADDPAVEAVLPALDEFYRAYEEMTGPSGQSPMWEKSEVPRQLRRLNALGCRALFKLAALRRPPPAAPA